MNDYTYNKKRVENQFFIDTFGNIVNYTGDISKLQKDDSIHYIIAENNFPSIVQPKDYVVKVLGWVTVGCNLHGVTVYKSLTELQITALYNIGITNVKSLYDLTIISL
jgi:hypothetical protein